MPHSPEGVANEFLALAKDSRRKLTPMQLQKLVYIAHGWTLAVTGEPLVSPRVQAWQWGPVYPSLYSALKRYGSGNVREQIRQNNWAHDEKTRGPVVVEFFTGDERAVIEKVWEQYGDLEAFQLSALTHDEGTPWTEYYDGSPDRGIPNRAIRKHFLGLTTARAA